MKDILEHTIDFASRLGADYSEARLELKRSEEVILKNGVPEGSGFSLSRGIGVRVLVNGSMGFASTNILEKDEVENAVKKAISMAKAFKGEEGLSDEEFTEDKWGNRPKIDPRDVDLEERISYLMDLDKEILGLEEEINVKVPSRFLEIRNQCTEKHYANSEGSKIESQVTRVEAFYSAVLMRNGDVLQTMGSFGKSMGWETLEEINFRDRVLNEIREMEKMFNGKKPPEGELDVVIGPQVTGIVVHESCGHPFEADRIMGREAAQAGESYMSPDKLGWEIGSEAVTIVEDPTLEGSFGFYLYDDEGVKARRRYLIKDGVANELLHNRETAYKLETNSNASARASSYDREPIVRMANTFMLPGDHSFEELVEDIKLGVYIKTYMEWNIDDRRWNQRYIGRHSYLIEDGEIKAPVREPILEMTTEGLYKSVDAVGNDLDFETGHCGKGDPMQGVPVWFGGPHVRLRRVRLLTRR